MAILIYKDPGSSKEEQLGLDSTTKSVVIGRHESVTLRFQNGSVSRRHCEIRADGANFVIQDMGSANGTKVNARRIDGVHVLQDGDRIECGEILLRFVAGASASVAPAKSAQAAPSPARPANSALRRDARVPTRVSAGGSPESKADTAEPDPARVVEAPRAEPARPSEPALRAAPSPAPQADDGRMKNQLDEMKRRLQATEQERDRLREGVAGNARERELLEQLRRAESERDQAQRALEQERAQTGEQASRLKELDERGVRYSMQLESVTEKYRQVREELDRLRTRLEQSREEGIDKDDRIDELERARQVAEEELAALRTGSGEQESRMREMKIRLTEKDRLLDQLHDQLAETEYELTEARGEIKQLQAEYNRDGGELARVEQKANVLREIIEDKENIIASLRRELEEKDRENKQVRMGVGMADLEEERRKVLDDFYKKSREVDHLTDRLGQLQREKGQLESHVADLERKLEDSDEYVLKQTESAKSLETQAKEARRELAVATREKARLEEELAEQRSSADAHASEALQRAQAEMAGLKLQVEQLQEKLTQARDQAARQEELAALKAQLHSRFEDISDTFIALRSQVNLLTTYVRDIRTAALRQSRGEQAEAELEAALDSFSALVDVLIDESELLQTDMAGFRGVLDA